MPTIRQLPPSLINKIAAGEVIERPASVVKELLENSIDAGATHIELVIESGGLDMIRISDDGCGIASEELHLAIASHATSKLQTADDLFDIHSLGFRGEALASIAEVSHLMLRSRPEAQEAGAELQVRGGQAEPIVPVGCPAGTVIEVRHLFFNTPVRRKFLRAPQTEASHVVEAFTRIALAYPQVHMVMHSGSRQLFDLPQTFNMIERIRKFFGDEIADSLISVESQHEGIRLNGFVTDPSVSRSNNRMQYLFLNGRHIRDRSLQHALGEAYRGLLMVGRFPVCFLQLDMPAQLVDVNVHPTKLEVRFQEGGKIYSQLLQTLRHKFLSSDLTARVRTPAPAAPSTFDSGLSSSMPVRRDDERWEEHAGRMSLSPSTSAAAPAARSLPFHQEPPPFRPFPTVHSLAGQSGISNHSMPVVPGPTSMPLKPTTMESESLPEGAEPWNPSTFGVPPAASADAVVDASYPAEREANWQSASGVNHRVDVAQAAGPSASHLGFQIHNRYLVTQDESGMVLIDQHALHERIIYEQLRLKMADGKLESQRLLVPEPLDLTPAEAAAALDSRELLSKIGIEVEPFGGDTVLMTSYPAMLAKLRPAEMLRQVLEPLMNGGKEPSARDLLDELLNMIACKAAIKAGDKLAPEEITSLLEQRYHYQDTHHCPHGRPTALFFSREQLDKMFKRT
ncbi:MAG: DNA mismatch repair endonuclease MutL [Pirellulales bacterium]